MPGAFFAKDLGIRLYIRAAGFVGLRIVNDRGVFELELKSFEFIVRVFDKKIQAAAYGTFHIKTVQGLRFRVWGFAIRLRPHKQGFEDLLKNFRLSRL